MSDLKALQGVEIKDAAKGTVEAVFSTFNVKDSDGDVTRPGAFTEGAPVRISAYGHASWGPSRGASFVPIPPVGKGVIRTTADEAILQGQFFLKTTGGADTFELIKEMGDQQEWSYGYDIPQGGATKGEFDGDKVRFLDSLIVHEVSPVLLGAGVGTRTLSAKSKQLDSDLRAALDGAGKAMFADGAETYVYVDDFDLDASSVVYCVSARDAEPKFMQVDYSRADDGSVALADGAVEVRRQVEFVPKGAAGLPFQQEADHALASVEAFVTRSRSLADLRAKEGRVLSAANRERLASLADALGVSAKEIADLLAATDPNKHRAEFEREYLRFEQTRARL